MTIRKFSFAFLLAMLSVVLIACSSNDSNDDTSNKETESNDKAADELVIGVAIEATTIDPAGSNDLSSEKIQANIFEKLTERDDNNEIVPGLAESWEFIDETTVEFKLRQGVKFHDGEDFNAEAVKMNINRILDEEVASPKANTLDMIESVTVINDYTVQVKTKFPFSPILVHLSHSAGGMVSPKVIEEDYAAMKEGKAVGTVVNQKPIGTGFLKFEEWKPDQEITLVKNEDYWGKPVKYERAIFKVIPETATRVADLERGFIHIAEEMQATQVETINEGDYATIDVTQSTGLTFIGFNVEKEPFNDVDVRKAMTMLINKQEIIDGVYEGYAQEAIGPLAPLAFGFSENLKPLPYDVEEATKILKEKNLEGMKLSFWTNDDDKRKDTAVILQSTLKELGIDMTIETMEFGAYLDELRAGKHDMYMLSWGNSLADGDNGLYNLFHSSGKGSPPNAMFFADDRVDELLKQGREEQDTEKRRLVYEELQQLLIDEAPMMYLNHPDYLTAVSNKVKGFKMSTANIFKIQEVEITQ